MKIAIITSSFFPVLDGVSVAVYNRVKQLSKLGHQVIVFCPDYSVLQEIYPHWQDYTGEIFPGVTIISLTSKPSIGLDFERDVTSKSYPMVDRELNTFQPDLIHVDEAERLTCCFLTKPGFKFSRKNKIPCVAFFHTNYYEYIDDYFQLSLNLNQALKKSLQLLFINIYNSYDLTLVSSKATYNKLSNWKIKNLCYSELLGIDVERFNQTQSNPNFWQDRYQINQIDDKIKLIFIGRLTPDKGWNFTLKAFSQLPPETLAKLAFIIIGDGDLKQQIKTELLTLTPDVYLLGRVNSKLIPDLLTNSDVFITNSEKETRGLAIIEACAAGIPVIAPHAGGIADTIIDGENGLLYQPQQITDFITKLTLLLSVPELRTAIGTKARAKTQQLSWQKSTQNLINIWQQQIEQKQSN